MPLALGLVAQTAAAQTQIRPRVMVMIDTSGSMSEHFTDGKTTGGDGSIYFKDSLMTRQFPNDTDLSLYVGLELGTAQCVTPPTTLSSYDGINSRMYAAKQALTNVLNGSGDIDWGLMRYTGNSCALQSGTFTPDPAAANLNKTCGRARDCASNTCTGGHCVCGGNGDCLDGSICNTTTGVCSCNGPGTCPGVDVCQANVCGTFPNFTPHFCGGNGDCVSGKCGANVQCSCTTDGDCDIGEFCVGGSCGTDNNLCANNTQLYDYGQTDTRGGNRCQFQDNDVPVSYAGTCGSTPDNTKCQTPQTCNTASDCGAGNTCSALTGSSASACKCTAATGCATNYTCTGGVCLYNQGCVGIGGQILVDPATQASNLIFPYVNGREDLTDAGGGVATDPELRAYGSTPLAGAARSAIAWYNAVSDTQKTCRPYVLVQITDGFDTCEGSTAKEASGPVAAAQGFVAATVAGAKNLNKVYVVGLAFGKGQPSTTLDNVAAAGGTGKARLANSQSDIEAALADIVASSVLVELCNQKDDDCDGICDNPFPDVAEPAGCNAIGGNPDGSRAAKTCTTSGIGHCAAPGVFACSADQRSEVCSSRGCSNGTGGSATGKAGNSITITGVSGFSAVDVGNIFTITGATNPGNVGNFTITAVNSATSITITNPNGVNEAGTIKWDIYCANTETCNGFDDNCNGVIDDCAVDGSGNPIAGSCCTAACPACARPDHIEVCNGCDDDCDNIIDDNLVDVGFACGNNVGDCAPGTTECCALDPNGVGNPACAGGATTDKLYCTNGNPGYPKPADLCDGTDDNCDGVANGVPAHACYTTPGGVALTGTPGMGVCTLGTQTCTTAPLPAGNGGCPAGWPAGKTCPAAPPTYSACQGAVGASPEVCNGLDDNCDGTKDNNVTDPWVGQPCCPTGNNADCQNAGGSTTCQLGQYACVNGGKTCVNGVAKSPEICDGVDNDCNGIVDDVPGLGAACGNNQGACRGKYVCIPADAATATGPNGLTCDQLVSPMPEVCNGKDDDCNGIVDDPGEVAVNDPRIGTACDVPVAPHDQPPCMAGVNQCSTSGQGLICVGAVAPVPNKCNGISTDCTGTTLSVCPNGGTCFEGNCLVPCASGTEFPCPGGYVCQASTNLCIPNSCAKLSCPKGDNCEIDSNGTASCVDPCTLITCTTGLRCLAGACVADSCIEFGCPSGQICSGSPAACVTDPCATVQCGTGQFCDAAGMCVGTCPTACASGQTCINGVCAANPCSGVNCFNGQTCAVQNGVGTCVTNSCAGGCPGSEACCGGTCGINACSTITCPNGGTCDLDPLCNPRCHAAVVPPQDQVVGAGGGGFACSVGGASSNRGDTDAGAALVVLAIALGWLWQRRRRPTPVAQSAGGR